MHIPPALKPLLRRPADWPPRAWRLAAAACRASGTVAWAAELTAPDGSTRWLEGRTDSRPGILQSECVVALIAALEATPVGSAVEVIAPTSLRYLAEGSGFAAGSPEQRLYQLARTRRVWARYALGELEALTSACLARAYAMLEPVRWRGESRGLVLYTDGGCTRDACAAAWVMQRDGQSIDEHAWILEGDVPRDGARLAEFTAAADGLARAPTGERLALITDHADVSDFGVRGVAAFRPSPRVKGVLDRLVAEARQRDVRWFWAARGETSGQVRCQALIDRQLQAAPAETQFLRTCGAAGLVHVYIPDFQHWLAPRDPLIGVESASWAATFERRDRFLAVDPTSPRLYLRQMRLDVLPDADLTRAFLDSRVAGWCDRLEWAPPLAGAVRMVKAHLRSGFFLVGLLFEPDTALLLQTRPGATQEDALDAAATVRRVDTTPSPRPRVEGWGEGSA